MPDDPLEAVYAYVERAYLRLQATDVLTQCLEAGDPGPIHTLVEYLVLAGPQSLGALREIHTEVGTRRTQLRSDQHAVFAQLDEKLQPYGVRLGNRFTPDSLVRMTPVMFLAIVRQHGVRQERDQLACVQVLQDSLTMIRSLNESLSMLDEIQFFLEDWLWGLIYQSTRELLERGGLGLPRQTPML